MSSRRTGRRAAAAFTVLFVFAAAAVVFSEELALFRMTFPEFRRLEKLDASQLRLSGCVREKLSEVYLNDRKVTVYGSGAFVGVVPLKGGENRIRVRAISGDRRYEKEYSVFRIPPLSTTPEQPLRIEGFLSPDSDLIVSPGQDIDVTVKGSPDCRAQLRFSALDGTPIEMSETLRLDEVRGVYNALLKIPEVKETTDAKLSCTLLNRAGRSVKLEMPHNVMVLSPNEIVVCETKEDARIRNSFQGTFLSVLPAGIRMRVLGKRSHMYEVSLSQEQKGWVHEEDIRLLEPGARPPTSMLRFVRYAATPECQRFTMPLDEKLPYDVHYLPQNASVEIRFYRCFSKLNWIDTPYGAQSLVRNVTWRQTGETCSVVFTLAKSVRGFHVAYEDNQLVLSVYPLKTAAPFCVVLDPGHGGADRGALGPAGTFEKDHVLEIARALVPMLESRGIKVVLTRRDDRTLTLRERTELALASGADLFVSIHLNAVSLSTDPLSSSGFHVFYTQPFSIDLAQHIYGEYRKLAIPDNGLINADYYVTRQTAMPSVLVECSFLTHPEEEMRLMRPEFRHQIAIGLAKGIETYLESLRSSEGSKN